MSIERLKGSFAGLPHFAKLIGIGSLVLAFSTILPWYADLDSYKIGDQFLGITGPGSFIGLAILILSGLSFFIFTYHLRQRLVPRLPVREAILHLFTGIESLFLLFIINSMYFHPKFGVNITLKESRFGMAVAFLGAALLTIGAYMQNKKEIAVKDEIGKLEPLIPAEPPVQAPQPSRRIMPRLGASSSQQTPGARSFVFGQAPRSEQPEEQAREKSGGSSTIRMDL